MADQRDDVVDKAAQMRDEEEKIKEHEGAERSPEERSGDDSGGFAAPPGEAGRANISGG